MVNETRSSKYKWLHDQVNRDINRFSLIETEGQQLSSLTDKLDSVDRVFFREKLNQFLIEQSLEKPYLETVKDNVAISENDISELKRILNELKNIRSNNVEEPQDEENLDELFNPDNKKYKDKLDATLQWLDESIERFNSTTVKHRPIIDGVAMTMVQQIRNRDDRSIEQLAKDLDVLNKEIDNKRLRLRNNVRKEKNMRSVKILLPIFMVLLLLIVVAIALVIVL